MATVQVKLPKSSIIKTLDSAGKRVFSTAELDQIYDRNYRIWRLDIPKMGPSQFRDYLVKNTPLKKRVINFSKAESKTIYLWKEATSFDTALAMNPRAYLTHYSAAFIHELTEQVPKVVYVNIEQSKKTTAHTGSLDQEAIDHAFSKPARLSSLQADFDKLTKIHLYHGQHTDLLGVIEDQNGLRYTNIERTLIDLTVRPIYGGGASEVLKAFHNAKDKLSVNKLSRMLRQLDFTYPYHQAIGFYLERAGYDEELLGIFERMPMEFDFYLTHDMKVKAFSKRWRIHYPENL